jgi:tetratricopeptide (TPR) repeat protein
MALFALRHAQGRLGELEGTIARSVHEYPALLRFRCAQAHLYAALGREGEARAALDDVLSRDLAKEYRDAEWLFSVAVLADPCAVLGDADAAARLYGWLAPYESLYVQAPVETVFGSVARALGVLATTAGHYDDAARHYDVALEVERRMGARPWLAHAQAGYARMLRDRGTPGDAERAAGLISEAIATYRELGMDFHAARAAGA